MPIKYHWGPEQLKKDVEEFGDWHFWIWPRQIGPWYVYLQWVRIKTEHEGNEVITTYRRPDNVILHTERDTPSW